MTSFKKSYVCVSEKLHAAAIALPAEIGTNEELTLLLNDPSSIEEITIIVRADMDAPPLSNKNREALTALDPLSEHLWLQTLQHLH